jgi:WD40 repeat protein
MIAEQPRPGSPYKGLAPFEESDAWRFFGRRADRQVITANLHAYRLTVLYGASGVGKSSVLNAGVVPNMRRRAASEYLVVNFRDWICPEPMAALAERLVHEARTTSRIADLGEGLPHPDSAAALRTWADELDRDLLFVLDQFEEYFLYHTRDGGGTFAHEFARAINDETLRANFLVSMREDALAGLDRFKGHIPNLFDNYLRLGYLDKDSAREAIRRPIDEFNKRAGGQPYAVDDDLVEELLRQVRTGAISIGPAGGGRNAACEESATDGIETAFLQVVLQRLWSETVASGSRTLRLATLQALGGAERIIQTQLDASMRTLKGSEQELAARAFYYLVTPSGAKVAYELDDLAKYTRSNPSTIEPVLERLAGEPRVLRKDAPPGKPPRYEIFHDLLAGAVLDWRARYLDRRSAARVTRWRAALVGVAVVLVLVVASSISITRSAFQTAQDAASRSRTVEAAATSVSLNAATAQTIAETAVAEAAADRQLALSHQFAAAARSQLNIDPELSVVLAREALLTRVTPEADGVLRQSLAQFYLERTLIGHTGAVLAAVLSPDGRRVATGGGDQTARVWDLSSSDPPLVLGVPGGAVLHVAFSPDGAHLLTSSEAGDGRVWDTATGALEMVLPGNGQALTAVAFSPVDRFMATGGADGVVRLWSTHGQLLFALDARSTVNGIAFSPDATLLLIAADDGNARLWDTASGNELNAFAHSAPVVTAAFSPDWTRIVTASKDGTARVWDVAAGELLAELRPPTANGDEPVNPVGAVEMNSAVFSPDGNRVVTASTDNIARIWSVEDLGNQNARLLAELRGHTGDVFMALFSGDNRFVVTASRDATARVWDATSGDSIAVLRGHALGVISAAIDVESRRVVTASFDGTARVWQAGAAAQATVFAATEAGPLTGVTLSPDGARVATIDTRGGVRLWEVATGHLLASTDLPGNAGSTSRARVLFSPDGQELLVTTSADSHVYVLDGATLGVLDQLDVPPARRVMGAFSADGRRVIFAADDGAVKVWDLDTEEVEDLLSGQASVTDIAVSGDDSRIVTASADRTARLWDARSGAPLATFIGHTDGLTSIDTSPDGERVVTGSLDHTLRLWDARTGQELAVFRGHTGPVSRVRFSRDGQHVLSGSADRTVRWWDVSTGTATLVLRGRSAAVTDVAQSPSGDMIASASLDGTLQLYPCQVCGSVERVLAISDDRVARQLTPEERRRFLQLTVAATGNE